MCVKNPFRFSYHWCIAWPFYCNRKQLYRGWESNIHNFFSEIFFFFFLVFLRLTSVSMLFVSQTFLSFWILGEMVSSLQTVSFRVLGLRFYLLQMKLGRGCSLLLIDVEKIQIWKSIYIWTVIFNLMFSAF